MMTDSGSAAEAGAGYFDVNGKAQGYAGGTMGSSKAHAQIAKPELSRNAGPRGNFLQRRRTALLEPDDGKEAGLRSHDAFRQSAPSAPRNPDLGHNYGRVSVFPAARIAVQPKLRIGQPGDVYEQEADRVADQVMRMPGSAAGSQQSGVSRANGTVQTKRIAEQVTPLVQREAAGPDKDEEKAQAKLAGSSVIQREEEKRKDEEEKTVQARVDSGKALEASPSAETAIESLRGGGQPLPQSLRAFYEPRFGHDFGRVRVHHDGEAAKSARGLNAQAFTLGNNIVFGKGRYAPGTEAGKRLLAHELTHVVQQHGDGEAKRIQTFRAPIPRFLGLPDIYIEPIPHTHPLVPCVPYPVTHIGVVARQKGPLSTGKGKIVFDLHTGFYRDPATKRFCFVLFESHATKLCVILCFPSWDDIKRAWKKIRDAVADALKYIFAAIGIVVAVWVIYLIADAIATALVALLAVLAAA